MQYQTLDTIRFLILSTSLIVQYFINIYLFTPNNNILKYILISIRTLSIIYLFLVNIRRGYVDYNTKEISKYSGRYCKICKGHKPNRTHHCSTCKKCIKKMDHHCMWIGACVNYDNHGDFFRFLFFGFISMISSLCIFVNYLYKNTIILNFAELGMLSYTLLYSLVVLILLGVMLKIQIGLISRNVTYVEDQYYYDFNEYDRGIWSNWCEVMGSPLYLWMWKPHGSGLAYEKNMRGEMEDV